MATRKQVAANRQNAQKSTGPRTPRGKAIVSQNAVRHGLFAATPVIPRVESTVAWEQHHATTIASLAPIGQVEIDLAERVALITWRLKRVARYERDVTISSQRRSFQDLDTAYPRPLLRQDSPEQARERVTQAGARLRVFLRVAESPPETTLTGRLADAILVAIGQQIDGFDVRAFSAPEIVPDGVPHDNISDWTVGRLKRLIAAIADAAGRQPEDLLDVVIAQARDAFNVERARLRPYTRELADLRRERILPQSTRLDQVIRYETHLTRQLTQTLAQLKALQHDRADRAARASPDSEAPDPPTPTTFHEDPAIPPRLSLARVRRRR
jgi:hypothetical protein